MTELKQQPQNKATVEYLDITVLEAASARIHEAFDRFSRVSVAFSGGKDSLVTLSLVESIRRERKVTEPLVVFFRDEEIIPDCVIDFVQDIAESGDFVFRYYCLPMQVGKVLLGHKSSFTAWGLERESEWIRQPPPYAIREIYNEYGEKVDTAKLEQYDFDKYFMQEFEGDTCIITGVRADESLLRFASCVKKVEDNWIAKPRGPGHRVYCAKPIYDWSELDVFKYFYETGIDYCPIYDTQLWGGSSLRVATPLHENAVRNLGTLQTMFPVFYAQLCSMFPEVDAHQRYWHDADDAGVFDAYEHSFDGVRTYIREKITDRAARRDMLSYVTKSEVNRANALLRDPDSTSFGGWPVLYVFKHIVKGTYGKSGAVPCAEPGADMIEYEEITK